MKKDKIKNILLYINTIKYLKMSQIVFRVLRRLFIKKTLNLYLRFYKHKYKFLINENFKRNITLTSYYKEFDRFEYCGELHNFTMGENGAFDIKWFYHEKSKLWNYALNYFTYIHYINPNKATVIIENWIIRNSNFSTIGCDPYPTSRRIINWIKFFHTNKYLFNEKFREIFLQSLYKQAFYLSYNFEFDILGNHLLLNSIALIYAGVFFNDERFFFKAKKYLLREIREQILPDGGHFERSPSYHALVINDLIDLALFLKQIKNEDYEIFKTCSNILPKSIRFLESMTHPDGEIAYFNDSVKEFSQNYNYTFKNFNDLGTIKTRKKTTEINIIYYPEIGYYGIRNKQFYLIADIGELGPSYIPGHSHNDILSFELSVWGKRFIVNQGISGYKSAEQRSKERSIESHNSVKIANKEPAELWAEFRAGKRFLPHLFYCFEKNNIFFLKGGHDGYKNIGIYHTRKWILSESLTVIDRFIRNKKKAITKKTFFHIHPDWELIQISNSNSKFRYNKHIINISTENAFIVEKYIYNESCDEKKDAFRLVSITEKDKQKFIFSFKEVV